MIFKDSQPDKQRSRISMNPFMPKCHLYCMEYFYMKIRFHWDKQQPDTSVYLTEM